MRIAELDVSYGSKWAQSPLLPLQAAEACPLATAPCENVAQLAVGSLETPEVISLHAVQDVLQHFADLDETYKFSFVSFSLYSLGDERGTREYNNPFRHKVRTVQ